MDLNEILAASRKASVALAALQPEQRKQMLLNVRDALLANCDFLLSENAKDVENARKNGMIDSMIDRLSLDRKRLESIAKGVGEVSDLADVVNIDLERIRRPNGLEIVKRSVPFGVIAMIFESRPNVGVDIASLCMKTANACVLKGGKEALGSNKALVGVMRDAVSGIVDPNVIMLIDDNSREITNELMTKRGMVVLLFRDAARMCVISNQ